MVEIYTKTVRRNGKILRASDYGLEAFRFEVPLEKHLEYVRLKEASQNEGQAEKR